MSLCKRAKRTRTSESLSPAWFSSPLTKREIIFGIEVPSRFNPAPNMTNERRQLMRVIGLPGAVMLGLGSIIGTGVFVSLGIGAVIAGPMVLPAIALAGLVAMANGLSSAQLAANHPVSGGTYEYGHRWLNPTLGFVAGWMFLCAKSASAATAALGFAWYVHPKFTLPVALALVAGITLLTLTGLKRSNAVNTVIISSVLLGLGAFVFMGSPALATHPERLQPLFDPTRLPNFLQAAALMFVAFTGYGRVATLGEEVLEPLRTIPRATITTLAVSLLLYLAVTAVVLANTETASGSIVILADTAHQFGGSTLAWAMTAGAAIALVSVLLNLVLGLSRVVLAMGRRGDLPVATAQVHENSGVPGVATVVVGVFVAGLVCLGDPSLTWTFSAFTVLVYYALTNLCAIRLKPDERLYPSWIAWAGLIACLSLAFFVDWHVILTGLGLIAGGFIWKMGFRKTGTTGPSL